MSGNESPEQISTPQVVRRVLVVAPAALLLVSGLLWLVGCPVWLIILGDLVSISFLVVSLVARAPGGSFGYTPRQIVAVFGIIPGATAAIGTLMLLLGLRWAVVYTVPALIAVGTFIYYRWFHHRDGRRSSNASGTRPGAAAQ